ncbi:heme peroxidase family protein [Rhizobium leguminosarum bv. trifolii WSM597]|uniref:Heme peroxidase family protein n=1 Tax=Rhizobium leguminosarum bv. trifolii WSM597 TaxID=754764 RepID=J0GVY1_RHILT|nr:heme peroxidase family protein [Rhizobium leguminosarum]EJB01760.1 heme peroxidase family protein [Rhizobium leguminosarum bv. trifolii WSM597]
MKPSAAKDAFTPHGGGVRGADVTRRSSLFEGRFGRMFRELAPATHLKEDLINLSMKMTADPETDEADPTLPKAAPETANHIQDDEENTGILAGYTYLGQFIDHDITFDPASMLMQQNDPDSLVDFRTPRLDLDSIYGRGPADQPYMYIGNKFRLGRELTELDLPSKSRDLPRYADLENPDTPARALIGDKRNDENVIVSQLHGIFLRLHNRLIDDLGAAGASFEDIQRLVRWHYQYVVLNDFLPRICGEALIDEILPHRQSVASAAAKKPRLQFFHWRNSPYMPIEFSVAAYRFGHSMVRPIYRLNTKLHGGDDPNEANPSEKDRGLEGRFFVFAGVQDRGLNGFGEFPSQWAIDWSLFFDINGSGHKGGKERAQPAYKIDTSLVNPLGFLPEFSKTVPASPPLTVEQLHGTPVDPTSDPANLAARNLLRGVALRLPSGQSVARAMGLPVIPDNELKVGKAVIDEMEAAMSIVDISANFADNAPLWYYVLAEAQHDWFKRATAEAGLGDLEPVHLGPMGGRIVAETLIGLVFGDGHSYLVQDPNWEPNIGGRSLKMGDLVEYALGG